MKTKIVLNEVIVSSGFKPEEIQKIEKFAPEMLEDHNDETGDIEFVYRFSKTGGCLTKFGIMFNTVDNTGNAAVKLPINCEGTQEEKQKWVAEEYGAGLRRAQRMEEWFRSALESIDANIADIIEHLEVIA